jgi:threonine/homoserine/homoserine lactone efflux protein
VHGLPVFLAATLVLLLTPGPAVLYIVARSVDQGRRAGLVSVLGIEAGNFVHVLAVTLGLSAVLASAPAVFTAVKLVGAGYLVYLGIRRILVPDPPPRQDGSDRRSPGAIFRQAVTVAVFNPKTALFFLAFLPQFVDPAAGSVPAQLFALGCIFVSMAVVTDGMYSLFAGSAGRWLREAPLFLRLERWLIGGVYIVLGITAALAGYR